MSFTAIVMCTVRLKLLQHIEHRMEFGFAEWQPQVLDRSWEWGCFFIFFFFLVTLYGKGTCIIMNSCINECMNYAFIHALFLMNHQVLTQVQRFSFMTS